MIEVFTMRGCGPCAELKMKMLNIPHINIDIDENKDLAHARGVNAVPTIFVTENGTETKILGIPGSEFFEKYSE